MATSDPTRRRAIRATRLTPIGAVVRGLAAAAVGTLAMDAFLFLRYRREGGQNGFLAWEASVARMRSG